MHFFFKFLELNLQHESLLHVSLHGYLMLLTACFHQLFMFCRSKSWRELFSTDKAAKVMRCISIMLRDFISAASTMGSLTPRRVLSAFRFFVYQLLTYDDVVV